MVVKRVCGYCTETATWIESLPGGELVCDACAKDQLDTQSLAVVRGVFHLLTPKRFAEYADWLAHD